MDPGLVATGYGVLERQGGASTVLASGVIATPSDLDLDARIQIIYDGVHHLLVEHTPEALVLEDLYAEYAFPRTALLMAHARGVVCLAARQCGVPVMALAPAEVKRAVAAHGAAAKPQVQHAIGHLLKLSAPPRPSHVADALALAWTGLSRGGPLIDGSEATSRGRRSPGARAVSLAVSRAERGTRAGGRSPGARESK